MPHRGKPVTVILTSTEQRMLQDLAQHDHVHDSEALRRALRLAYFCRLVPEDALMRAVHPPAEGPPEPTEWRTTGEVRVSVRGELVAERMLPDGTTQWVPASPEEVAAYLDRTASRRR